MIRAGLFAALVALAPVALAQTKDGMSDALRVEMVFWESVRSSTDPADFRAYLERYPDGQFAPLARNRLAALGAKPAAPAAAAPAPKPVQKAAPLAVGDTWTYQVARGAQRATQDVKLVSVTLESVVEEILGEGSALRLEHRTGSYLVAAGDLTLFSPYLAVLGPAMVPGAALRVDNLDSRTCNAGWACSARARVIGREKVQVPAGIFDATRIDLYQTWSSPSQTNDRGEMGSRSLTVWYVPEVKRVVKIVSRGPASRFVDTRFDVELVSYKLQ